MKGQGTRFDMQGLIPSSFTGGLLTRAVNNVTILVMQKQMPIYRNDHVTLSVSILKCSAYNHGDVSDPREPLIHRLAETTLLVRRRYR